MPLSRLAAFLVLLLVAQPVAAQQALPALSGHVVDQGDILSPQTEGVLTSLLESHERATSNQVVVLTVPGLEGEPIEMFALRVGRTWGLGTREYDNGVLMIVAPTEREVRIEVGYGLEGSLPDAVAARIIREEIVPHFRQEDYDSGVVSGAMGIVQAVEGTYLADAEAVEAAGGISLEGIGQVLMGLFFMLIPSLFAFFALFMQGCLQWFLFFFLVPFYFVSGFIMTGTPTGGFAMLLIYAVAFQVLQRLPFVAASRERTRASIKAGHPARASIKALALHASAGSGSSFSSGSGGSSSSGGGSSSFSGGGGSFGGGGASGSW